MHLKHLTTLASALALAACAVGPELCPARDAVGRGRPVRRRQLAGGPAARAGPGRLVAAVRRSGARRAGRRRARRTTPTSAPPSPASPGPAPRCARSRSTGCRKVGVGAARNPRTRSRARRDATTSFDAGLDVAYEVDLFGRVSRNVEAARGDVGAAEADADAVRVAIVAETARAYADAASAAERLAVAQRIVELLDQSLQTDPAPGRGRARPRGSTPPASPRCATSDRQRFRPSPPSATPRCSGWRR